MIKVRVAGQYVVISEYGRWYRLTFSVIDLGDTLRGIADELRVMEFVAPIGLAIEGELAVA